MGTDDSTPPSTQAPAEAGGAAPRRTAKTVVLTLALATVSLLISLLLAELAWRLLLSSDTKTGRRLKNPRLYADPFSDDLFWQLRYRWQGHRGHFQPPKNPHPRLGWHSARVGADYSQIDEKHVAGRRPVLLFGDSFAQSMPGVRRFEQILNQDEAFSRDHYLLNYGIGGYGLDQIYLLFESTIDRFDDPFVIFSFMTFDLDRSALSVRIGQKPYFELEEGSLVLRGVPIESDAEKFYAEHPPFVGSYLLRRLSRLPFFAGDEATSAATARKKRINGAILERVVRELESRQLDYVIFVFHARKAFIKGPDWRSTFIRQKLDDLGAPYLWSYDILRSEAPDVPIDELFDPKHVHPTSRGNEIFAAAMAERVMASAAAQSSGVN